MKKEKEIHTCFAVAPQTAKVMATEHNKSLVKMENALNLCNEMFERERDHMFISFITGYCYNCSYYC